MSKEEAEQFPGAMRHVRKYVYPIRKDNRREAYAKTWWRFVEPRVGLRTAIKGLKQVAVVPCVSPWLIVARQNARICFDHQLMVIALRDAYHFGILQSRFHALRSRARGSTLKGDLRYTNTTIFETFPFPRLPDGSYRPQERADGAQANAVASAAEAFEQLRSAACTKQTLGLTKIHTQLEAGQLPELGAAYAALNDAVSACYGFPEGIWRDDRETLRRLLELNYQLAER